ncbi:S1C family serine protease [Paenibacillus sp. HW567]|uniref:S1C family serine protease n=1 Tax=Paenibacillus sp. HW567 TaxID=1034769 RepID=UPI000363DDA3|nr:trypsin-like peptidase domain-containing protein [Paenibacillus sp. HW567]
MSAKVWVSMLSCLFILGAGTAGAMYIHKSAEQQLDRGPLLAAAPANAAKTTTASVQDKQPKTRKEIIEASQKRVVTIESGDSLGSGFLYNSQGDLLTNAHVVEGSTQVTVRTLSHEEYQGTVIGVGVDTDIAVVRVPKLKGMVPLTIARSHKAEVGDEILALGSPLGLENTVTTGIVSGVDRDFDIDPYVYSNMIQISAPITHGNSGGPLVDATTGEVLGINSATAGEGPGIGFSIPVSSVLTQVEEWSKNPLTEPARSSNDTATNSNAGTNNNSNVGSGAGTDEDNDEDYSNAEELVLYFYESLNNGDYVTAYSLLGSDWQSTTSYENFRNGYLKTNSVTVYGIEAVGENEDSATVNAFIIAEERHDSGTVNQKYQLTYTLGVENGEMKILHGNGKKVK